jgi:hypothetical protein
MRPIFVIAMPDAKRRYTKDHSGLMPANFTTLPHISASWPTVDRTLLARPRTGRLAMSLQTPTRIRTLQRKLYCKAEPEFRCYLLYDKIWREDILAHAWSLAKANGGAPGVDGTTTFAGIEAAGLGNWLAGLRAEVRYATVPRRDRETATLASTGSGSRTTAPSRGPCDEASRRAAYRRSARPIR